MQQSTPKHSDSKQESLFLMNLSVSLVDLGLAHLGGSASRCAYSWTSMGTLLQMHSLWVQNESWQLLRETPPMDLAEVREGKWRY